METWARSGKGGGLLEDAVDGDGAGIVAERLLEGREVVVLHGVFHDAGAAVGCLDPVAVVLAVDGEV